MNIPSKAEQIESLIIPGGIELLVKKYLCVDFLNDKISNRKEFAKKVINITRHEIKEYLKNNYSLIDLIPAQPKEGLFAEKIEGGYILYYQDYGRICSSKFIENEDKLLDEFINEIINTGGYGINFDEPNSNSATEISPSS